MGCNGTVGLSAGRRVAGGDSFWLGPHPELEFTLYEPATSGAQGGQDAAGRRLIFLLMPSPSFLHPPSGSVRLHRTPTFVSLACTLVPPLGWRSTATHWLAPYYSLSLAGIPSAR